MSFTIRTTTRLSICKDIEHDALQEGSKTWIEFSIEPEEFLEINDPRFNVVKFEMNSPDYVHEIELTYDEVEELGKALLEMVRIHNTAITIEENNEGT